MKIGIVTFWQTRDNYGQMLQCYALQRVLKNLGHDPYLIRYLHSEYIPSLHDRFVHALMNLLRFKWSKICLKRNKLGSISNMDNARKFENFKKYYLSMSSTTYQSYSELRQSPPEADCYITGSDQVWNRSPIYDESRAFFLDFGEKDIIRCSYAASFSNFTLRDCYKKRLEKLLKCFNAVSVRENSGKKICDVLGIKAYLVCDPTVLLTSDNYKSIFNLTIEKKEQVYIYSLNISSPSEIRWNEIKTIAKKQNLDILVTPSSGYIPAKELFGNFVNYQYSTVENWLENIANSKVVVTTSFHGIVFCLLFHTPFIYVPLKGRLSRGNNRIVDLLTYLGVEGHILNDDVNFETLASSSFNWKEIDYKISKFRDISMSFLTNTLKNGK